MTNFRRITTTAVWATSLSAAALHAQVSVDYLGRLGFRDARHTGTGGFQWSQVIAISDAGYSAGESQRFVGSPDPAGGALPDRSAWLANPFGGTRSIGLYDAIHTSGTGSHASHVVKTTRSGRVIGHSTRYHGQTGERGQSAWVADWAGGTRRIGLFYDDASPPLADGTLTNVVMEVNEAGQTIGYAPFADGQHAWFANAAGETRIIGLLDPAQQSPGYAPFNTPVIMNASGTVVGHSTWDNGSGAFEDNISQAAWLQSKHGGPSVRIGLYGPEYVEPGSGQVVNAVNGLNASGHVIGRAERGAGGADGWLRKPNGEMVVFPDSDGRYVSMVDITKSNLVGYDYLFGPGPAYVYDIATGATREVGIVPPDSDLIPANGLINLTENGVALGSFSGQRGTYYWLARPDGETETIGYYGYGYEWAAPGAVFTDIIAMNDSGVTIGTSDLQAADGVTAWVASPVTLQTYRIGLIDGIYNGAPVLEFTRQTSVPTHVTNSRFIAGYSVRYHYDNTAEGQTAWVYNSPAGRYAKFVFSVRASDGYAYSRVNQLLENGVAIGTYTLFADDGTDLGDRAFVWITRRGAFDLGSVLDVDPETVGWDYLASAIVANDAGFIAGHGALFDSASQGVFLSRLQLQE